MPSYKKSSKNAAGLSLNDVVLAHVHMGEQLWQTWKSYVGGSRFAAQGTKPSLPEMSALGSKWVDMAGRQAEIIDALAQLGGKHQAKFTWLASDATCQKIRAKMQDVRGMAETQAFGADQNASEAELMWTSLLDYAYSALRCSTGHLHTTTPQAISVLASGVGSIDPLVACVISGFHPTVMAQHGREAALALVSRRGIANYLHDTLKVDTKPLRTLPP